MTQRGQDHTQRLLTLIASEPNPERVLIEVAADSGLVAAAKQLLGGIDRSDSDARFRIRTLCLAHGLPRDLVVERLRLIVSSLDLGPSEPDYYQVLGVSPSASSDEIKRAFRKASLESHPDRNPDRPDAEERFRHIHEAYKTLGSEALRASYDRRRMLLNYAGPVPAPTPVDSGKRVPRPPRKRQRPVWPQFALVVVVLLAIGFAFDLHRQISLAPGSKLPPEPRTHAADQVTRPDTTSLPKPTSSARTVPVATGPAVSFADLHRLDIPGSFNESASRIDDRDYRILHGWERPRPMESEAAAGTATQGESNEPIATGPVPAKGPSQDSLKASPQRKWGQGSTKSVVSSFPGSDDQRNSSSFEIDSNEAATSGTTPVAASAAIEKAAPGADEPEAATEDSPRSTQRAHKGQAAAEGPRQEDSKLVPGTRDESESDGAGSAAGSVTPASAAGDQGAKAVTVQEAAAGGPSGPAGPDVGKISPKPPMPASPKKVAKAASAPRNGQSSAAVSSLAGPEVKLLPKPKPKTEAVAAKADRAPPAKGPVSPQMVPLDSVEQRFLAFLNRYIRAFERRDLAAFSALFEPGAIENGKPFATLIPQYQDNFARLAAVDYKVSVRRWQVSSTRLKISGTFEISAQFKDQRESDSTGSIEFVLRPYGNDFRVSRLTYSFKH